MPSKKFLELQDFSDVELVDQLKEVEKNYQKLQFDHAIKGLDNPLVLKEIRRDIARLKTEARKRQVGAMSAEQLAKRSKIRARRRKS